MTYAYDNGIMKENSIVYKDLYENESALAATDYFYKLSCDSNYIRRQRIKKRSEVDNRYRVWNT